MTLSRTLIQTGPFPAPDSPAAPPADDAALLRACRAGDQEAWERLIYRYQRLIYTIPLRMGLGEDQAAEVFQQVCLTLLEHLDRIGQPDRIGAWLATTARRASLLLLRREQLTVRFPADEGDGFEPEDHAPRPDALAERAELHHEVRRALASLDPRSRALLALLYASDEPLSYAEIAETLGMALGSIGPTRARSLQKLQLALQRLAP
jgi:RNA polymerase sigma factor (sigma-70 family)